MKSIRREDNGAYICTIKQFRGSESTSEKSQSIIVRVIGKMRKNIPLLRRVKSSIQGKRIVRL